MEYGFKEKKFKEKQKTWKFQWLIPLVGKMDYLQWSWLFIEYAKILKDARGGSIPENQSW